jgi:SHS2 domain-containing protein
MARPIETGPSNGRPPNLLLEQGLECPPGLLCLAVVALGCAPEDKVVAKISTLLVHHSVGHDLSTLVVRPLVVELTLSTASEVPSATRARIIPAHPFPDPDLLLTKGTLRHLVSSNRWIIVLFDNRSAWAYDFFMWPKKPSFTALDHTADMGIIVRHRNLEGLFEAAAAAMMYIMVRHRDAVEAVQKELSISGVDLPDLMIRWLGEILYLFDADQEVVTSGKILALSQKSLKARISCVPFDPSTFEVLCGIKAVTYHQTHVGKKDDHWEARVIFDR